MAQTYDLPCRKSNFGLIARRDKFRSFSVNIPPHSMKNRQMGLPLERFRSEQALPQAFDAREVKWTRRILFRQNSQSLPNSGGEFREECG